MLRIIGALEEWRIGKSITLPLQYCLVLFSISLDRPKFTEDTV